MATTTNYSWTTPNDTDLVKDGAAAIRSLGTAIDSTVFTNAGAAINKTIVDAKGDLIVASGADAVARLAIGTNDYVLTADSAATNGIKWAALPASGGLTLLDTVTLSGASTTSATFSSSYKYLQLYWREVYGSVNDVVRCRFNADTGSNYSFDFLISGNRQNSSSDTSIRFTSIDTSTSTKEKLYGVMQIWRPSDTDVVFVWGESITKNGATNPQWASVSGVYDNSAAITSVTFFPGSGTFTAGTLYIYGGN